MVGQDEISRAFRLKALETHPDKSSSPDAGRLFSDVVRAYETLSDLTRRAAYDLQFISHASQTVDLGVSIDEMLRSEYESIMDTLADDVLEEYIVGNALPPDSCLLTFFRDLEKSEVFVLFRDGKVAYQRQEYQAAAEILSRTIEHSPGNILYRHYYALSLGGMRRTRQAIRQFKTAIRIGEGRYPRRNCPGVRRALHDLYRRRGRLLRAWWMRRTQPELFDDRLTVAERERQRLKRILYQEQRKRAARRKPGRALQVPGGQR